MTLPLHLPANFTYDSGLLFLDGCSFQDLASEFGTPLYVYSEASIEDALASLKSGLGNRDSLFCYSVKSNSNLEILRTVARNGGGADIVSGGELFRVLRAGIDPTRVVFSGVGKTHQEMKEALEANILLFIVESKEELKALSQIASSLGQTACISIRANPDVDPKTHPYIATGLKENKFGVARDDVLGLFKLAVDLPGIVARGIGFHIGSQLTDMAPFKAAASIIMELALEIRKMGVSLSYIDVGGGLGIPYQAQEVPPPLEEYVRTMSRCIDLPGTTLIFEPGRILVGQAGALMTKILYHKPTDHKNFYICDAAMNDLLRPSLYQAYHETLAVRQDAGLDDFPSDLVGPICETGDFLVRNRKLPSFRQGDLAVLSSTGAYGFVMSSNYNSRVRAAEVLIRNGMPVLIRERETYEDLIRGEI